MSQFTLVKKRKRTPGVKLGRPTSTGTGARQKRESFKAREPLHISLRLREGLPNLRTRKGAQIVKHAIKGAQTKGVRIVHFAILSNHLHLIVEASDPKQFYRAMKSFCIRLGIQLRRLAAANVLQKLGKLGLFRGRYHVRIIRTPQQMKQALQYVLLNPAKHFKKAPYVDAFTSAGLFDNWAKLLGYNLKAPKNHGLLEERLRDFVSAPRLWLTDVGWMRAKDIASPRLT